VVIVEQLLERHSLALREYDFFYPLYKKWTTGQIVPCIVTELADTICCGGDPLAGMKSAAIALLAEGLAFLGVDRLRAIFNPFHRKFGFHPDDFVLLHGYRKNYKGELVTERFEEIVKVPEAKPMPGENGKVLADLLLGALGKFEGQKVIYGQEYLDANEDRFMEKVRQKDVLCVGGPIPNDPLRDAMAEMDRLPANYKLRGFTTDDIHPPKQTRRPDIVLPKYPIVIKGKEETLYPEWDELDWGMITCVDKQIIFEEKEWGKAQGLFFNVSGCHWFGTHAAGTQLLAPKRVKALAAYVESKIGACKNFQVIFKVNINPETKAITSFDFYNAFKVKA
jgi:hypothetical protein